MSRPCAGSPLSESPPARHGLATPLYSNAHLRVARLYASTRDRGPILLSRRCPHPLAPARPASPVSRVAADSSASHRRITALARTPDWPAPASPSPPPLRPHAPLNRRWVKPLLQAASSASDFDSPLSCRTNDPAVCR
ncbi:hypothetical protein ACQJBY_017089 [Aegilops geniculata]